MAQTHFDEGEAFFEQEMWGEALVAYHAAVEIGRWLVYFAGWLVCPGSARVSSTARKNLPHCGHQPVICTFPTSNQCSPSTL